MLDRWTFPINIFCGKANRPAPRFLCHWATGPHAPEKMCASFTHQVEYSEHTLAKRPHAVRPQFTKPYVKPKVQNAAIVTQKHDARCL